MSRMGLWLQIPDNAWVKVWVEGSTGSDDEPFTAQGRFHSDSGDEQDLEDLHLRPRRRKLKTPENYTIRVTIDFAGAATAFVVSEVTSANGQPVPEAFSQAPQFKSSPISGSAGEANSVTLFLVTQTGPGGNVQ